MMSFLYNTELSDYKPIRVVIRMSFRINFLKIKKIFVLSSSSRHHNKNDSSLFIVVTATEVNPSLSHAHFIFV